MVGSKDLQPSEVPFFPNTFFNNQYLARTQWPPRSTNLSGQTAIVTGSNTGLGYEAAMQLLGLKLSRLVLAVRSLDNGKAAAAAMRKKYSKASIEVWELDMCSYDSVRAFAKRVDAELSRIDIVILNAGRARLEYHQCESTGHEEDLQVNYLSTILLALLLLPTLKAKGPPGQPAHLTISSAALTLHAKFLQKDKVPLLPALDDPNNFDRGDSYVTSKLLAEMFLWNLVDYVSATDVIINLADPALVRGTNLARDVQGGGMKAAVTIFGALAGRSPKVGASCYIDAVVNKGKESHGCFLMSWKIHPYVPTLVPASDSRFGANTSLADSPATCTRLRARWLYNGSGTKRWPSLTLLVFAVFLTP
jgi:NAD(P)-dependent dehydrogenase (short-subunit alcohol dehydrogenase family)